MSNFDLLQEVIISNQSGIEVEDFIHPLYQRFIKSYKIEFIDKSLLDIAILLRQILLHQTSKRKSKEFASLEIPINELWPTENEWEKVGIKYSKKDNSYSIYANWYKPEWMENCNIQSIDFNAVSEFDVRNELHFKTDESDIFLKVLNQNNILKYKSNDQKRAVRSALSLNNGETLAISLPTGEGKSLIIQLIDLIGFPESNSNGLTLVIVPTVTLALDQEKSIQKLKNDTNPYAFVSKRDSENNILKENIRNGTQSICFMSPEAAYGPLRNTLIQTSQNGLVKAVIVDEAHIIEEWGSDFRMEFQLLSGLWRQLLTLSPTSKKFRTIMLSATYTQNSIETIKTLFSYSDDSFNFFNATKLRPEIDYWIGNQVNEKNRKNRVFEAILNLPRPLILYTSKVEDANNYYYELKEKGFQSIAVVTGKSTNSERDSVIEKWKNGTLDLVVATSAFGLGIDYKHTRSVIHACIPETINRYYQEVGRGGRDGKSSLSLILPTKNDLDSAYNLNSKIIIGNELGFLRWNGMFQNKIQVSEENDEYIIDLYTAPKKGIDYKIKGIKDWNIQVLQLMAKSRIIQLCGVPTFHEELEENFDRYITIKILKEQHLDKLVWNSEVDKVRTSIYNSNKESLNLLLKFMTQKECPSDIIAEQYQVSLNSKKYSVSKLCGSCVNCRGKDKLYMNSPMKRAYPEIKNTLNNSVEEYLSHSSIMVEYTLDDLEKLDRSYIRKFTKVIKNLLVNRIQNFIFTEESLSLFIPKKLELKIVDFPIFFEKIKKLSEIIIKTKDFPNKEMVLFLDPKIKITKEIINILNKKNIIVFILKDTYDPITIDRKLSDTYKYEIMNIEEFIRKASI